MDAEEIKKMNDRIEAAVRDATDRELAREVNIRLDKARKDLDDTVREIAKKMFVERRQELTARVEEWLAKNVERCVEVSSREMLNVAFGEIRARVLGRRG